MLALLLVLCTAVACGDDKERVSDATDDPAGVTTQDRTDTSPTESDKNQNGEDIPEANLRAWFEYGTNLTRRDKFSVETTDSIAISMAKNEMEGFQLLLASTKNYEDLRCEVSALSDGKGNTLMGEVSVVFNTLITSVGKSDGQLGYTPTAIMNQDDSYVGGTFDMIAGRSKTLYVLYETDENTVAGTYTGRLEVKQGDAVLFAGDVSVTVWDIYYDEATRGIHMFGYGSSWPHSLPASAPHLRRDYPELLEVYCDALVNYRMTPYRLPVGQNGLLDEKAAKYLDNPRVSLTVLWEAQQSNLKAQYELAKERGWLDKVAFLCYDEPHAEDHVQNILAKVAGYQRSFPTKRIFNPLIIDIPSGSQNIVDRLASVSNIHCVKQQLFDGEIAESMLKLKEERGDTIMWYVCGDEPKSMADGLPSIPGTEKRVLFWSQYRYNLDGFLMWSTDWWFRHDDIWEEGYEEKPLKPGYDKGDLTGNGVHFYWHPETKKPLYTLGLEAMRDGIEDYQLLCMAEDLLGRETVLKYVTHVTRSRTDYTKDDAVVMEVRNALANALLEATAT